jgi:putative membrane protein
MSPGWQRLHPMSLAVNLVPRMLVFVRAFWPILVLWWVGGVSAASMVDGTLLMLFFLVPMAQTAVHFFTLRYRMEEGRLEIEHGLLNRQARVIDPDRVQNVELTRNLFQRPFGLVEVRIETASGTDVEGMLSALRREDAEALVAELKAHAREPTEEEDPLEEAPVVVANGPADLIRYGVTATRIGAVALLVWGVLIEGVQVLDPREVGAAASVFEGIGAVALALAVITGGLIAGVGGAILRHWDFKLRQVGDRLVTTEGLFTERQVQLRTRRVQIVRLEEPFLRRMLGFGSIHIETAAARMGAGGIESAEAVVPVVDKAGIASVLAAALPDLDADLEEAELLPPHRLALVRNLIRSSLQGVILAGLASWAFYPLGLLAWVLVPILLAVTVREHQCQGWLVTERYVIARRGWVRRTTWVVARHKLQVLEVVQGPLLRRYGLGRLVLRVPGDAVGLPMLDFAQVRGLLDTLTPRGLRRMA